VSAATCLVFEAQRERVGVAALPQAVESGGIPQGFVGDLREADGVRLGAFSGNGEGLPGRVVHVGLVVGAVEILAVPARGEVVDRHDTTLAGFGGELGELGEPSELAVEADEAKSVVILRRRQRVCARRTNRHAEALKQDTLRQWVRTDGGMSIPRSEERVHERSGSETTYRLRSSDLDVAVGSKVLLRIVDGHPSLDTVGESGIFHKRDLLVGTVRSAEEHHRRPIVGEVLGERAGRACALLADVTSHVGLECVAANDLMQVRRGRLARLDERIEALDGKSPTAKA